MEETPAAHKDKLLVLDLDETLIYATTRPDFRVGPYSVFKCPGVDVFLNRCFDWFQVAVWTSASPDYAAAIVAGLFPQPPAFVWASDRCTWTLDPETGEHCNAKNLRKIKQRGYNLEAVIVVDDSPEKHTRSYGNLVRVTAYLGDETDQELLVLLKYLDCLRSVENIRKVEKRRWRSQTLG